jgi:ubiquinone/menaquinone biosynthesis C-methylase UbiE
MATKSYIPALGHDWLTNVYDPAMATLFQERLLRAPLINALDVQPGQHILDIGCGTGTVSLLLRKRAAELLVVGLDIDPAVLSLAQRKAVRSGAQLPLSLASADSLPYANDSYDHVLSSLMLHHLTTAQKGRMLAEAWRVLRPGQLLSILDFGPPRSRWLASLLATLASGFEHIDDNLHGRVPELLAQAGFAEVQVRDIAFGGLITLYQGRKPAG